MSSSGNKYSVNIINGHSPTTSRHNMASRSTYSTGSGGSSYPSSASSRDSSSNVQRETYRSYTAEDYRVDAVTRSSGQREVMVLNHHARGYIPNAPTPGYGSPRSDSRRQQRP